MGPPEAPVGAPPRRLPPEGSKRLKSPARHRGAMVHTHVVKGHPMSKYEKQGSGLPTHLCKAPPPTVNEAVWYGHECRCCGELIG